MKTKTVVYFVVFLCTTLFFSLSITYVYYAYYILSIHAHNSVSLSEGQLSPVDLFIISKCIFQRCLKNFSKKYIEYLARIVSKRIVSYCVNS
jgi:hypothetical protein